MELAEKMHAKEIQEVKSVFFFEEKIFSNPLRFVNANASANVN